MTEIRIKTEQSDFIGQGFSSSTLNADYRTCNGFSLIVQYISFNRIQLSTLFEQSAVFRTVQIDNGILSCFVQPEAQYRSLFIIGEKKICRTEDIVAAFFLKRNDSLSISSIFLSASHDSQKDSELWITV